MGLSVVVVEKVDVVASWIRVGGCWLFDLKQEVVGAMQLKETRW